MISKNNDENHQHQIIFRLIDKISVFDASNVLVTADLIISQNASPGISKVILRQFKISRRPYIMIDTNDTNDIINITKSASLLANSFL